MPKRLSSRRSAPTHSARRSPIVIFTSFRSRAAARRRTTVTRPTPNFRAISFWVISSTKYIHAARKRKRRAGFCSSFSTLSVATLTFCKLGSYHKKVSLTAEHLCYLNFKCCNTETIMESKSPLPQHLSRDISQLGLALRDCARQLRYAARNVPGPVKGDRPVVTNFPSAPPIKPPNYLSLESVAHLADELIET